jgi:DNA-binding transcriptional ArsR family regulator
MPSAFSATLLFVIDRDPWQPTLIYPARGIATLWEDAVPAPDGLARLLGATRAAVLHDLGAPRSTGELARRLSLSPAGASHHVTALRDAGLLTARREGRAVLYVRTPLGDALANAPHRQHVEGARSLSPPADVTNRHIPSNMGLDDR